VAEIDEFVGRRHVAPPGNLDDVAAAGADMYDVAVVLVAMDDNARSRTVLREPKKHGMRGLLQGMLVDCARHVDVGTVKHAIEGVCHPHAAHALGCRDVFDPTEGIAGPLLSNRRADCRARAAVERDAIVDPGPEVPE